MYLFFSFFFRYFAFVHEVLSPFIDIHCTYLFLYVDVCFSFTYPFMCCFFSPFIHMLLITCMHSIYFCFIQRCVDEFCLKCFRNTGCQSLLAINSLLAKLFKSLCYDRFYCIQRVWVKWFMTSLIYSFACCGFVTDCQRGRLLRHMCFTC